ncbi:MAG TPA: discoidin domain-containing protein [Streptosporangiaceae bacterium]|nr:discoidin domain-containing protein [Streptosporangiaceae bacterium]
MPEGTGHISRRGFMSAGATLLAGLQLSTAVPPASAHTKPAAPAPGTGGATGADTAELAQYRPVTVSSTDYAATPAWFAVDRLSEIGVRGSGWRAQQGDPQWIAVDLQAPCLIESVVLTFEATLSDPTFIGSGGINPRDNTTGFEVLSAAATAFTIDVSNNRNQWTTVYSTDAGTGGVMTITLPQPVTARYVRMSVTGRSNGNPLGLNGFEVYGTAPAPRPTVTGWTDWPVQHTPPPPLKLGADGTVPLESGWRLTLDDWAPSSDGAVLSGPSVDTSGWLPATVPGTVLASLVEQGHLPDPVFGWNNLQVPEALSRHSWWYRRPFVFPKGFDTSAGRHIWLEFDGINHQADIWLNGANVGQMVHPFARAAIDVTANLAPGQQYLAVLIAPMPFPGNPGDKGPSGISYTDAGINEMNLSSPTYLSVSGWDWMPAVRDRVCGIWNHVRLRSTGAAVIGDPRFDSTLPSLPDTSVAEVTITVPVSNVGPGTIAVTVTAALDAVSVGQTVTITGGQSTDVVFDPSSFPQLRLTNPQLWWPNGYGDPNLHHLVLTTAVGGAESDRRTLRVGIRQIDYDYEVPIVVDPATDSAPQTVDFPLQQARYLRIQGGKRATGWGISMWTLSVFDTSAPGTDLALGKTATASSVDNGNDEPRNAVDGNPATRWSSDYTDNQWITVDLGSVVSFDQAYILWERAYALTFAVQVSNDNATWTDVIAVDNSPTPLKFVVNGVPVFCRGGSWGWDELLRRMLPGRMHAVMAMHRDMNFTMVRSWVGTSHREEFFAAADANGLLVWSEFWDAFSIDPVGHTAYLALAQDTLSRYRTHPSIAVWFGCNEGTPPAAVDSALRDAVAATTGLLYGSDSNAGFITGDGPYFWLDPTGYFTGDATGGNVGFHSEIGIPTVSVWESMLNLVGPEESGWPIEGPWFMHDWCTQGNQAPQSYQGAIDDRLAPSTSMEEFCRKAQFVNYESMRAIFEAWNSRLWNNATGVLLWMSNPAWHSTVWQTYDYDLDVNGSYYGSRKGCEPQHIQANLSDWSVVAVNHTTSALSGATALAWLYDLSGNQLGTALQATVDVAASGMAPAFTVPFDGGLPALHLLRLELHGADGTLLSQNTYWRYNQATDMQALNSLGTTTIAVSQTYVRHAKGGEMNATLRNTGTTAAAMVRLSLRDKQTGDRILPTLYSDNFLWLLPSESLDVSLSWTGGLPTGHTPELWFEGYNVPAGTV